MSVEFNELLKTLLQENVGLVVGLAVLIAVLAQRNGLSELMKVIVLLRGINVGGNKKISMPELCGLATQAGFREVRSYINSGNLIFEAGKLNNKQVEDIVESLISEKFGFHVEAIVRTADEWISYVSKSPFPDAKLSRPKFLHLGVSKKFPSAAAVKKLNERACAGERIEVIGDVIWVDFRSGVGKSKLTPVLFDKAAGSTVTMRNWNTVQSLATLLGDQKKTVSFSKLKRKKLSMPSFIRHALTHAKLMDEYRLRPAYQQNDYIAWITRAVRKETQEKRLSQMIHELKRGDRYMKMVYRPKK